MIIDSQMPMEEKYLLAVNGGSSSIKLALYQRENPLKRKLYGKVERIGLSGTTASFFDITRDKQETFSSILSATGCSIIRDIFTNTAKICQRSVIGNGKTGDDSR